MKALSRHPFAGKDRTCAICGRFRNAHLTSEKAKRRQRSRERAGDGIGESVSTYQFGGTVT